MIDQNKRDKNSHLLQRAQDKKTRTCLGKRFYYFKQ